jgi:hypothetical protein
MDLNRMIEYTPLALGGNEKKGEKIERRLIH